MENQEETEEDEQESKQDYSEMKTQGYKTRSNPKEI